MKSATQPRRRRTAKTTSQPRMSVEEMLREIAYVLHVTKKVRADELWPVPGATQTAQPLAAAGA